MHKGFLIAATFLLLCALYAGAQQQEGSVLEKRITIKQQSQTLRSILDQISWQAGVYFSYDASIVDAEKEHGVDAANQSLFTVLSGLFSPAIYQLSELGRQIIISKKRGKSYIVPTADSVAAPYFFLSGKVIDNKKGGPVPYASISIFKRPIGTITNSEGEFLLKIPPGLIRDSVVVSCMGFVQQIFPAYKILDQDVLLLEPISIRIREVRVTAISANAVLAKVRENLAKNYSTQSNLMTAFYRETVRQDGDYINVSEAVLEILKAPYDSRSRNDLVRLVKGRRSPDVKPFQWLNFKLQGGPFTITQLDAVKTMETFLDERFENLYNYEISKVVWHNKNPVYVLEFKPASDLPGHSFVGEMLVHRETFAVVSINFHLNKKGLRHAKNVLVKKKPKGVKARPTFVAYRVDYRELGGKWYLTNARASVKFKIRSKRNGLNSEFHSVSDLLIADIETTDLKRFARSESFTQRDVLVELLGDYDTRFWENYNIIKPDEDLRNAFRE